MSGISSLFHFVKDLFVYLFERQCDREKERGERSCIHPLLYFLRDHNTLSRPRPKPGSQESGTSSESSNWVTGDQLLGPSSSTFLDKLTAVQVKRGTAKTLTTDTRCQHHRWWRKPSPTASAPCSSILPQRQFIQYATKWDTCFTSEYYTKIHIYNF